MPKAKNAHYDKRIAGAFARNGINTLMLDIREQTGALGATLQHVLAEQDEAKASRRLIHEKLDTVAQSCSGLKITVDRLAPLVDVLEGERVEKRGVTKFLKNKYVIATGVAGAATAGWHQWEKLTIVLGKVFK